MNANSTNQSYFRGSIQYLVSQFIVIFLQVLVYGVLVAVSVVAINRFFSPITIPVDLLWMVVSWAISFVAIAAFFSVFMKRDTIFRLKGKLTEELSKHPDSNSVNELHPNWVDRLEQIYTMKNHDLTNQYDSRDRFFELLFSAIVDIWRMADKAAVPAGILLLILQIILVGGDIFGLSMGPIRNEIQSAFINVIFLVAIFGIIFKDYAIFEAETQ